MAGEAEQIRTSLSDFVSRLTSVQIILAAVISQLAPVLIALNFSGPVANLLAVALALAIVGGAYLFWRQSERRRTAAVSRERHALEWAQRPLQAAFRALYSYTRQDELPGTRRRQLAKLIATQVAHPTFRYGVICGEIGAGKSSLVDSGIGRQLEAGGFSITLVRGLQEVSGEKTPEAVLESLRSDLRGAVGQPVLILDQFEDMLIHWQSEEARRQLGEFLSQPLKERQVRVLCCVRSDYLIMLHDLSPHLSDPTSSRTLFPVKNLDEDEAAEIIIECAERDGVNIGRTFATTIAADLAHQGIVRPPELQLVCVALESKTPEKTYRIRGGAEGILSAYVREATSGSLAPDLARLALRGLCNFGVIPPAKTQPKSVMEIAETSGEAARSAEGSKRLEIVLKQLAEAGLLAVLVQENQRKYALVHDYLVQPIAFATSETTTEAERATQLLRLHLTEYAADTRTRIPPRRLRLINRYADRELLRTAGATRLIGLSRRARVRGAYAISIGLFVGLIPVGAFYWSERSARLYQDAFILEGEMRRARDRDLELRERELILERERAAEQPLAHGGVIRVEPYLRERALRGRRRSDNAAN